ncbi:DUF2523 family protein [Pasteurella skyensis]|uniref:DUF2523 family protein n=1 Tax=Phocoenobacter skyensis TaxID=97481 RepID=A0AAJ6P1J7_9PAST|nr:DUF2523 family protein [Pasteurella skyensis]MDP8163492.1 DUF2523 family protein [Pasteurella skyensis]MDP8173807.1 DUF2523 family protein [Pasteurella skyensis]MDP8179956.1 DUF2523 family protein [Pasteurella skyensis]MDP8182653.1 DUF2523 family protein [Pasteurella skyensis]MDP8182666.1 DUF2523 family protein [Pasteurella skyensis]
MGGLIIRLFSGLLVYVFKGIVVKFFLFFGLFYVTSEFIPLVIQHFIPDSLKFDFVSIFNSLPLDIWYFLELFRVPFGVNLLISAMVSRFIIRRLPIIG